MRRGIRPAVWGLAVISLCVVGRTAVDLPLNGPIFDSRADAADANQPRGLLVRDPADAIAISFDRPHLVFEPDERFRAAVTLNLFEPHEAPDRPVRATLKWKVTAPSSNRSITEGLVPVSAFVNSARPASVALELHVPHEEGVYNVRLAAVGRGFAGAERVVQIVVVDPAGVASAPADSSSEKAVDAFEPASAGPFRKITLSSSRQRPASTISRILRLKSARDDPDVDANSDVNPLQVAYRLRVTHPGHAHRLELSIPREHEQSLTVSVMQSDEQGQLAAAGPDFAISVAPSSPADNAATSDSANRPHLHRQVFWPRDREPILVVTSRLPKRAASIAHVALYDLGESLPGRMPDAPNALDAREPDHAVPRSRLVGLHLHKPRLAETFGAPRSFDSAENCSLDDWQTFLLAGRRLTEYLRCQQYSALLLGVLAEGSAIYPSRLIEPSLVHDNGRLARNGQDPIQKDVLELLLRLFDRANLALVVELQFDSKLPALERFLDGQPDSSGDVLLVDRLGRTRVDDLGTIAAGVSPYNVLSPRVQKAVLDVVQEMLQRYKAHPALAGVAFELRSDSCLQLPGIDWGYENETIDRFERDSRMSVPGRAGDWPAEAHRFLTTTARREWLRFRCAEVARFHRKLADLVARELPRGRVLFTGHLASLGDSHCDAAAIEAVRSGGNPGQLFLFQGLDFSQSAYGSESRVTVLRPVVHNDAADRLVQAAWVTLNNSPAIDGLYRGASRGGLISTVTGAACSSLPVAPSSGDLTAGSFPSGAVSHSNVAAHRYSHLVATLDAQVIFDGGATFPLRLDDGAHGDGAQGDGAHGLRQTLERLPEAAFRPAGPQTQPVATRILQAPEATWVYAVNDSALELSMELTFSCPATTGCFSLATGRKVRLESVAGERSRLQLSLAGNDLAAFRLDNPGVDVLESRLTLPEPLLERVHSQIESLSERMNAVSQLARTGSKSLSNPGFEQPASGQRALPGWEFPVEHAAWTLDDENPRSGARSLRISGEGERYELETPELPLEGSRFVTMSIWMRSNRPLARAQMQFDAKIGGQAFRHQTMVEVGRSWKQYVFQVDELPAGRVENAHLRVGAVDSCKLWIDDVEIDAQAFGPDEVRQLTKTLSSVKLAWKEGRFADCQRLLDGYWGQLLVSEPVAPLEVAPARPRLGDRLKTMFRRQ